MLLFLKKGKFVMSSAIKALSFVLDNFSEVIMLSVEFDVHKTRNIERTIIY